MSAVPELRFPEYDKGWQEKELSSCGKFIAGLTYSPSDIVENGGGVLVLRSSNVQDSKIAFDDNVYVDLVIPKQNMTQVGDILICVRNGSRRLIGKTALVREPIEKTTHGAFMSVLRADEPSFIFYLLFTDAFFNEVHKDLGATINSINTGNMKRYKFHFPSKLEQKKIAAFLSAVDEKLAAIEAQLAGWRDFKRGMMQALFTQTLRFKADDGSKFPEWTTTPLNKLAKRSTEKNSDFTITRVLSNSAVEGVVDQTAYFDRNITTAANLDGYYVVRLGDFVYNPRVSSSAPVGPISRNKIADGVMSPLYTIFTPLPQVAGYLEAYFKSNFWNEYVYRVSNVGARHDRMNILTSDFMDMPIHLPSLPEQQKIANYLSVLDTKIDALTDRLDATREFKRGLLQKMFV